MGGFVGGLFSVLLLALAVALGMWGYKNFFGGAKAA